MRTLLLALSIALASCGGYDRIEGITGREGKDGKDGKDGRDGKDYVARPEVTATPVPTWEPIPRPIPTMQPSHPQNTDVIIILTPPYPDCTQTNVCPQNAFMACVCLNNRWETVFIMKHEAHKYNIKNLGACYYNDYECGRKYPIPTPTPRGGC
jgi:hypothetical protein